MNDDDHPLRRLSTLSTTLLRTLVFFLSVVAAVAAGTNSPSADLAELSIEQLAGIKITTVYGASRHAQTLAEAPSAVTIISKDDIQKSSHRTLAEILNGVRGFYTTSDRAYSYIGVRGISLPGDYGGRLLICIDGHRINDPIYNQSFSGMEFPLDVDLIDRVEVIRGPGASLYGDNAMFGVINVITRQGRDFAGGEASGSYASYDTWTGRLSYGNRLGNGVEFALSGTGFGSDGHDSLHYPEFSAVNGGHADHLDDSQAGSGFASLSYRDFAVEAGYAKRDKTLPTAAYSTVFNAPGETLADERAFADVRFQHQFERDWGLMSRLYYDHYRFDGYFPSSQYLYGDPLYPGPIYDNVSHVYSESLGGEVQISKILFEKHRLAVGLDYRHDFSLRQLNYDEGGETYQNTDTSAETVGLYAQDEYTILPNLIFNANLRFDHHSSFGSKLNPRAALIYSPWTNTTFKAIYGQAYRTPAAYELYYYGTSAPNLKTEASRSYELDFEQNIGSHFSLVSSVYYYQMDNLIGSVVSGTTYTFGNVANAASLGGEIGLEAHSSAGWRANLSYTYADARDTDSQQWLPNSPRNVAKASLTAPLWREKVFANLELLGLSSRRTVQDTRVGGYVLANLNLFSHNIVKNLDFSAGIYNLFDTRYSDPVSSDYAQAAIEQDGRSFRFKLTYRF